MLKLKGITKDYITKGVPTVHALRGLDINFRRNEFVAVLGASGCGKTTLLNILGGLDRYTNGDMIIQGISTKDYGDRDWDTYRNHSVGFVFQAYNLIGHRNIVSNVELALTISGISKEERKQRAKEALKIVGLEGMEKKKPNQLSGGQMQRVAIARALVNNPEILLADEPTGALDSETSIQIMDLLKEVAKDRLVIMVTHNPELALSYANRIVKMSDGLIVDDSNPYEGETPEEREAAQQNVINKGNKKKSSMSFLTAMGLSCTNLISKRKRTILVSLAGSIGIIGISCVLAISEGVSGYIESMQNDMLSGNPINISSTAIDYDSIMNGMSSGEKREMLEVLDGNINVDSVVEYIVKMSERASSYLVENELTEDYVAFVDDMPKENYAAKLKDFGFRIENNIYTDLVTPMNPEGKMTSISGITSTYTGLLNEQEKYRSYSSYISSFSNIFSQVPNNEEYLLSQYDLLGENSRIAKEANEIMIVVDRKNSLTDISLAQTGYFSQDQFLDIAFKAAGDDAYKEENYKIRFTYEELLGKKFYYYPNDSIFKESHYQSMTDLFPLEYCPYSEESWENGLELKVVGILEPKDTISYGCLSRGFYYTEALANRMLADSKDCEIVKAVNDILADLSEQAESEITSLPSIITYTVGSMTMSISTGIHYSYQFQLKPEDEIKTNETYLGSKNELISALSSIAGNIFNTSTYYIDTRELGGVSIPRSIDIYPNDFESKNKVTDYLDVWNDDQDITLSNGKLIKKDERTNVKYNDTLEIIINLIDTLITGITTALIAFTALSLVVSCFMIAVITYISVVERVKEIGVIRSLGGRKKDVSRLFIAECLIIGFTSGIIGVGVTYIFQIIFDATVGLKVNIPTLANLSLTSALIMLGVSIILNVLSGLLPSMRASHQDPVVALRSE